MSRENDIKGDKPRQARCGCKPWDAYDLHSSECRFFQVVAERDYQREARGLEARQLNKRIAELEEELAKYTTHDHAPCMYCDPLRSKIAELESENAKLKADLAERRSKSSSEKIAELEETLRGMQEQRDFEYRRVVGHDLLLREAEKEITELKAKPQAAEEALRNSQAQGLEWLEALGIWRLKCEQAESRLAWVLGDLETLIRPCAIALADGYENMHKILETDPRKADQ